MYIYGITPGRWYNFDDDTKRYLGDKSLTGIYALYDNSGLIYIGHSTRIFARLRTHEKKFLNAKFKIVDSLEEAQSIEKKLIRRLRPPQNKEYIKTFEGETKRFNSEIDLDVYTALKIKASVKDVPVSIIVNEILREKLKKWIKFAEQAG